MKHAVSGILGLWLRPILLLAARGQPRPDAITFKATRDTLTALVPARAAPAPVLLAAGQARPNS